MKHFRIIMLLGAAFILLCACPNYRGGPPYITIVNNSERNIVFQESYPQNMQVDSMIACHSGAACIKTDSLFKIEYWGWDNNKDAGWYDYFVNQKYIQFIIMDEDTYWKYHSEPCDTIRKYVPILHVYRLSLEDLESMNWTVVYPPKE